MPRMARLVVPDYPHHVTQRGARRQQTFFTDDDYRAYLDLIKEAKAASGVDIWAYCLMPNHVHLVAVPKEVDGLAKMLRMAHHRYARRVNATHGWRGHLWQERFHSYVMDESHLLAAVRYIELNPVRARLCTRAEDWHWSSVGAYLRGESNGIVNVRPMLERVTDWREYLALSEHPETIETLRSHSNTGRPAGSKEFITALERISGRTLRKRKTGPHPRS